MAKVGKPLTKQGWYTEDYDFKGNLLEKTRQVIKDSELLSVFTGPPTNWQVTPYLVDWTGLPASTLLDTQQFVTTMEYDALNRAMKVTYPQDVNGNRKELTPTYNRAGTLTSVDYDGTEYLKEIAYNAKGQPLLAAYGNGIMTRYAYDEDTFRPVRLKSEKYTYSQVSNTHTYAYNAGTTKQDFAYEYDLIGNIMKLHDRTPDCGYGSTPDELDKLFNYDPLYRVLSATGRESTSQTSNILWGDVPAAGSPNASVSRGYSQAFRYDKLGNMMELNHTASSNSYTRNYLYNNYSTNNKLSQVDNGSTPATVYSTFNYDVNGNMTGSDTDRHYTWDAADQLKAFSIQVGTSEPSIYAQYLYSGGQRIKKIVRTAGGDYEVTVYDGPFEYCKKVSGATTYEKNYSHIEGAATVRTGNGTLFPGDISDDITYQLPDNLGSSNLRLDVNGTILDKEEYYPFGDTSLRTFTYKRYRYVNKEKDQESGLYYYGARYYAAWTCRFISVDPLAKKYANLNPYNYADNNPINDYDIDGMQNRSSAGVPTSSTQQEGESTSGNPPVPAKLDINMLLPKFDFLGSYNKNQAQNPPLKLYTPTKTAQPSDATTVNLQGKPPLPTGTTVPPVQDTPAVSRQDKAAVASSTATKTPISKKTPASTPEPPTPIPVIPIKEFEELIEPEEATPLDLGATIGVTAGPFNASVSQDIVNDETGVSVSATEKLEADGNTVKVKAKIDKNGFSVSESLNYQGLIDIDKSGISLLGLGYESGETEFDAIIDFGEGAATGFRYLQAHVIIKETSHSIPIPFADASIGGGTRQVIVNGEKWVNKETSSISLGYSVDLKVPGGKATIGATIGINGPWRNLKPAPQQNAVFAPARRY